MSPTYYAMNVALQDVQAHVWACIMRTERKQKARSLENVRDKKCATHLACDPSAPQRSNEGATAKTSSEAMT